MDTNWIMAIIAIAAILSPAIVSIIDNIFKYQSKKLELSFPKQQEALSEFVTCAMAYYPSNLFANTIKYMTAKNNLYVYFSNVPTDELNNLETLLTSKQFDKYKDCIELIVKKLSQQIYK